MVNEEAVNDMLHEYRKLDAKIVAVNYLNIDFKKFNNKHLNKIGKSYLERLKGERAEIYNLLSAEFDAINIEVIAIAINNS